MPAETGRVKGMHQDRLELASRGMDFDWREMAPAFTNQTKVRTNRKQRRVPTSDGPNDELAKVSASTGGSILICVLVTKDQQVNPGGEEGKQNDQGHQHDLGGRVSIGIHHVTQGKYVQDDRCYPYKTKKHKQISLVP